MGKNQIDVALNVETILIESGLEYEMCFNPNKQEYYFKLTNIDLSETQLKD